MFAALLHGTRVLHVSQTAVLSRGRHLYSAGRPSRWASAHILVYWATVSKTVRPMLSDRFVLFFCPVLSICDVGVLWPNGWTDQDETWLAGRPAPWKHCVRWGPSSPPPKEHSPQFSAHICCGQMAAWINMSLGMEVGLSPGDFVLDGDPAPPQKKSFIVAKRLDGSRWYLAQR